METSCGLILRNGDLILLLRYPQGHWGFPKGHVEENDLSHQATAIRELEEETGITDVEIISNWFTSTKYTYIKKNIPTEKEVHWFPARTNTMNISLSEEHTDYIWIDVDSAEEMITFDEEVRVLQEARKILRF
ncbi:MAG: bis(5'-nucleosyl)-tetraphosphatase [Candidatus Thalassarchaeaceae archaeon]|nr:MAG: diadenosine tetraphosphate hydrolase [Euryarchaeota archaeon]RPG74414.1 MAG: NUDIX domain-containing protein [Euryarchaeota archaeon TMED85]|tara:strand:- start:11552 stop:11950 length:399 start_codon:yes stop_codon:yes gene_type:complete